MLSYEALLKEAGQRGIPTTKIRGILREYLHILILKSLSQIPVGKQLYLSGGTYLRLVHNLRRFSENLAFYTPDLSKKDFKKTMKDIRSGLKRNAIEAQLSLDLGSKTCRAQLTLPKIEKDYRTIGNFSKKQGVVIPIEAQQAKWPLKTETEVIAGFGELFPCVCVAKGILFAERIAALAKNPNGRDLYDIIFMLLRHFPVEQRVLTALKLKTGAAKTIIEQTRRMPASELKHQAQILQTFLFEEHESDLIINAHEIVPRLAETLQ